MERFLHSHTGLLVRRLLLLYAVMMITRVVFWLYNWQLIGGAGPSEWWPLICGALKFDTASVLYANGIFIFLSLLPFHFRARRWYRTILFGYYLVVNSLLVVATNLADAVYFRYTLKRFTADEIFFTDNANSLQLAGKFALENWYLVLVAAALVWVLAAGYARRTFPRSPLRNGWVYYSVNTLILLATLPLIVAGIRGGMTRMTRPITLSNATLYASGNAQANLILSNPFCIIRTIGNSGSVKVPHYFDKTEVGRYFSPYHYPRRDSTALPGKRNVVIFIMESMSAEHSAFLRPDLYADDEQKGYTPFLDSLMRNGFVFRQMYANGSRSIQAMPAVLGSIPSFKTPFVLMPQSLGESRQLPAMLRDRGYATAFLCGSERGSMGFGAYARSAGVERLLSREDYEARHGKGDFDGYWGIWDEEFLRYAGEEFGAMPEPFFAALFTLSAHHPFVVPAKYETLLPSGQTRVQRGAAYDDLAFRRFFERYGKQEWFRRTIFVFVADHVSSERFSKESLSWPGDHHVMGFIYTPDGVLTGQYTSTAQQIDLMPTLLGLLGNEEPYFAYGRDLIGGQGEGLPWSVSYDNGYRVVSDDLLLTFDERQLTVTPRDNPSVPLSAADSLRADSLARSLKALIQQYYSHLHRKSYVVEND